MQKGEQISAVHVHLEDPALVFVHALGHGIQDFLEQVAHPRLGTQPQHNSPAARYDRV